MDTLTVVAIAIIALVILAVVIVWYGKRGTGKINVKGSSALGSFDVGAETQESAARPEQLQVYGERNEQEMPGSSTGRQIQYDGKDNKQKMT